MFGLLGGPIPENWRKRGWPARMSARENRNIIKLLLALWEIDTRWPGRLGSRA